MMSLTNEAPIAVGISLASNASPQQVAAAKDLIDRIFGVQSAPGMTPAEAAEVLQDTATPAVVAAGTLDATGVPWDERIHSGSKGQTKAGVWNRRKNVSDADFARITAELLAVAGATPTAAAVAAPALPSTPALPGLPGVAAPALPVAAPTAYQVFVRDVIAPNLQSPENPGGKITSAWVDETLTGHYSVAGGLANLAAASDDVIAKISADFKALGL